MTGLNAKPLWRRISVGVAWTAAGTCLARGATLIGAIVLARWVGKDMFGEIAVLQSTVGLFQAFGAFGLGLAATRFVAGDRNNFDIVTTRARACLQITALTSFLAALFLWYGAAFVADRGLNMPTLASPLRAAALCLPSACLTSTALGILIGLECFRGAAVLTVVSSVVPALCIVPGATSAGAFGAACALSISSALVAVAGLVVLAYVLGHSRALLWGSSESREWRAILAFSLATVTGSLFLAPVNWLTTSFVVRLPGGAGQIAVFNVANQWRTAILFLPAIVCQVLLPFLSDLRTSDDQRRYYTFVRLSIVASCLTALACAVPISLLSHQIMSSYGNGFVEGAQIIVILAFSAVLIAGANAVGQFLAAENQMWFGAALNGAWAAVIIAVSWQLRGSGAKGLAVASTLAYVLHAMTSVVVLIRLAPSKRRSVAAILAASSSAN